jgi:putative transposase
MVDLYTRECLDIDIAIRFSFQAEHVVRAMNTLKIGCELPKRIACDNASEFAGGQIDLWAYANNVILDFSRRGNPNRQCDRGILRWTVPRGI